jgi:hypothetical protein
MYIWLYFQLLPALLVVTCALATDRKDAGHSENRSCKRCIPQAVIFFLYFLLFGITFWELDSVGSNW